MTYRYGKFVWFECFTPQVGATAKFYGALFGWSFEEMPIGEMTYTVLKNGEVPMGGLLNPPMKEIPPHWAGYISVEDVDAKLADIEANGGKRLMDPMDIPTVGRSCPVEDPQGGRFFLFKGLTEDPPNPTGPGAFWWSELATSDAAKATAWYAERLGQTGQGMDMPNGTYHLLSVPGEDKSHAGIMDLPAPGVPTAWLFYINVEDLDATIAKCKELGGKPVMEPMVVEGVGRFVTFSDPNGAFIAAIQPPA